MGWVRDNPRSGGSEVSSTPHQRTSARGSPPPSRAGGPTQAAVGHHLAGMAGRVRGVPRDVGAAGRGVPEAPTGSRVPGRRARRAARPSRAMAPGARRRRPLPALLALCALLGRLQVGPVPRVRGGSGWGRSEDMRGAEGWVGLSLRSPADSSCPLVQPPVAPRDQSSGRAPSLPTPKYVCVSWPRTVWVIPAPWSLRAGLSKGGDGKVSSGSLTLFASTLFPHQ